MSEGNVVEGGEAKRYRENKENMESAFNASREGVPEHVVILVIAYDTIKGNVQLQGPIANKHMSYAMLELARDCIVEYNRNNIAGVKTP